MPTLVRNLVLACFAVGFASAAEEPPAREPTSWGTWKMVAVVVNGREIPIGAPTIMTVKADGYSVTVDGKPHGKGTARVDLSKTPLESDVSIAEGPGAGTVVRQITKVEGDVLIACQATPGADRPTAFVSKPGSNQTLSVWIRSE